MAHQCLVCIEILPCPNRYRVDLGCWNLQSLLNRESYAPNNYLLRMISARESEIALETLCLGLSLSTLTGWTVRPCFLIDSQGRDSPAGLGTLR